MASYAPNISDLYYRAAIYVDKILKGAKPVDLPVELRGLRLSPYDALAFLAWLGISRGHFQRGHYAEAIDAARRSIQSNPHLSSTNAAFAAALAKLGRIDEAQEATAHALALQPNLTIGGMCAAFGIPHPLQRHCPKLCI